MQTLSDTILCERSLTGRRWMMRACDERMSSSLAQRHALPELLARMLISRGVIPEEADQFLNPSLKTLMPDPSHLKDMDVAAERLAAAVITGETIAIFGDYDVDGATSTALLTRYFRTLGCNPLIHIPDRITEGYGPNTPALMALKAKGASVIITVDCGTLAFEPLAAATDAGVDVIVVDHHLGEARKPHVLAVVNPNRLDETSPCRQLAAVGVAFLLAVAVNRVLRKDGFFATNAEPDLKQLLDLVALGTVCDVVPLTGLNRAFVAQGLKVMAARGNTGIAALLDVARVTNKPGTYQAGFMLGPRVNAGGRVGKADFGARLLATDDPAEALMLARELDRYNEERRAIESMMLDEAMAQAEAQVNAYHVLLLSAENWHPGIIGIIAGRVKERFHKPVAVIAWGEMSGKASARSIHGFDFGAAVLAACEAGILAQGGGHAMAAGFTVTKEKSAALHTFLNARAEKALHVFEEARHLWLDGCISVSGATVELAKSFERAGPYGAGHASVRVAVQAAKLVQAEPVGNNHLRLICVDAGGMPGRLSAIAFRVGDTPLGQQLSQLRGKVIDLAGSLKCDEWQGREMLSFVVDDAHAHA